MEQHLFFFALYVILQMYLCIFYILNEWYIPCYEFLGLICWTKYIYQERVHTFLINGLALDLICWTKY